MDGLSTSSECMQVGYKGELLVCCPGASVVRHFQALGCRGPCGLETWWEWPRAAQARHSLLAPEEMTGAEVQPGVCLEQGG